MLKFIISNTMHLPTKKKITLMYKFYLKLFQYPFQELGLFANADNDIENDVKTSKNKI